MKPNRTVMGCAVALGAVVLAGCAAGDVRFGAEEPAGFLMGLWHGVISVVALVIGIFSDGVQVYERSNTGGWYDLGFLMGVITIWGGASTARKAGHKSRREKEWEEVGAMVDEKVRRKIREWAEAEPDEDWGVVETKAEDKLKLRFREWAEKP